MNPLVSCIMPTYDRRRFVPLALQYFLRQDYPNKELIVVDDGSDAIGDLLPQDEPRLRYVRLEQRMSIGAKRNLACEIARGDIIAHWDDDDWQAPYRLRYQVEELLRQSADLCGIQTLLFYTPEHNQAWRYEYLGGTEPWVGGSSLCYTRAFWERTRFPDIDVAEDARFVAAAQADRIVVLQDHAFHIGIIHPNNVSAKQTDGPYWQPHPVAAIRDLVGADWPACTSETSEPLPQSNRPAPGDSTFVVARAQDLDLPEFAAFNPQQSVPWMRRWEMPFALFQSRLSNTASVLDCSINPTSFGDHLARLYPFVHYTHRSPVQQSQFALPIDTPDTGFDRVVCINTLEHLLKEQRETLIATLARKLTPDGQLVLTCDAYFDSAWQNPTFLEAGVMRADKGETFNGWNKVTAEDLVALCARYGLHPVDSVPPEPVEDEPGLYVNQPPFPHACVGAVFSRSARPAPVPGKRIVLSLLVWNTADVSLESVRAHLAEARMLRRLGYDPYLCVCDNGSTDGTRERLQEVAPDIDMPHQLIFNTQNRGNTVARNQIIDYTLECRADYLLMMDGDIEVVPFSTVAMLRYLENSGHQNGAIGADHWGFTAYRDQATPHLFSVDASAVSVSPVIAYTQYGLFRREVFERGVRFEEHAPFDGAGWGFEDNDLAFQMHAMGYRNLGFKGMQYLHRDLRSSVRIMRAVGIDAAELCRRRKQYVIEKWAGRPIIDEGPLDVIRQTYIDL